MHMLNTCRRIFARLAIYSWYMHDLWLCCFLDASLKLCICTTSIFRSCCLSSNYLCYIVDSSAYALHMQKVEPRPEFKKKSSGQPPTNCNPVWSPLRSTYYSLLISLSLPPFSPSRDAPGTRPASPLHRPYHHQCFRPWEGKPRWAKEKPNLLLCPLDSHLSNPALDSSRLMDRNKSGPHNTISSRASKLIGKTGWCVVFSPTAPKSLPPNSPRSPIPPYQQLSPISTTSHSSIML